MIEHYNSFLKATPVNLSDETVVGLDGNLYRRYLPQTSYQDPDFLTKIGKLIDLNKTTSTTIYNAYNSSIPNAFSKDASLYYGYLGNHVFTVYLSMPIKTNYIFHNNFLVTSNPTAAGHTQAVIDLYFEESLILTVTSDFSKPGSGVIDNTYGYLHFLFNTLTIDKIVIRDMTNPTINGFAYYYPRAIISNLSFLL